MQFSSSMYDVDLKLMYCLCFHLLLLLLLRVRVCACVRKRSLFLGGGAVGVLRQGLGWPDWDSAFILRW